MGVYDRNRSENVDLLGLPMRIGSISYWHLEEDGNLVETEMLPGRDMRYVHEVVERHSADLYHHKLFCPQTRETRNLETSSENAVAIRREKTIREMLTRTGEERVNGNSRKTW
jgi:hypothetical protein